MAMRVAVADEVPHEEPTDDTARVVESDYHSVVSSADSFGSPDKRI